MTEKETIPESEACGLVSPVNECLGEKRAEEAQNQGQASEEALLFQRQLLTKP